MELLHEPPDTSTFVSLAEHQSTTPESFFEGPPVLHLQCPDASLKLQKHTTAPALAKFAGFETPASLLNGDGHDATESPSEEVTIPSIHVYVLSSALLLYRASSNTTLRIPYPSIGLHAVAGSGLYLQISTAGPDVPSFDDHDPDSSAEATITPEKVEGGLATPEGEPQPSPVQALYAALSACANLHPDPALDGDEDAEEGEQPAFQIMGSSGGDVQLPPAMPGSGGWITAENLEEYFDEDGNWKGEGPEPRLGLGPGAGTVRVREGEDEAEEAVDGEADDESKWQRTS